MHKNRLDRHRRVERYNHSDTDTVQDDTAAGTLHVGCRGDSNL